MIQLRVLGGAMSRVPADATAFAHRDAAVMAIIITGFEDPTTEATHRAWTEALHEALGANAVGVYSNFLEAEGEERIRSAYPGGTYERLSDGQAPLRPIQPVPHEPEHPPRRDGLNAGTLRPRARSLRRPDPGHPGSGRLRVPVARPRNAA